MDTTSQCISRLKGTGQDHLLKILEEGNTTEKSTLIQQLTTEIPDVDFNHLNNVLRHSLQILNDDNSGSNETKIEPPPKSFLFNVGEEKKTNPQHIIQLESLGYNAIYSGKIAFLILAGGSGTRLGASVPKGFFTCNGLQQKKSLFQIHCEKIKKREALANANFGEKNKPCARIHLLIMTSAQNDAQTRNFFIENNFFGLHKEQVHFFQQTSLPCYDESNYKILLESPGRMCLAPGGNAGVYSALTSNQNQQQEENNNNNESVLERMKKLGVTHIQIGNVDNMLSKVADPLFIGYTLYEKVHIVVKTSPKIRAEEAVGVFARVNNEWGVVEYTEIRSRAAEIDNNTGELKFNCANISSHMCSVEFLQLASDYMKTFTSYHAARKKIATINGLMMGVKLEAFIFDFFRFAKECPNSNNNNNNNNKGDGAFRIMQVDRNEEFAPIKNADGAASDTPLEAARLTMSLHTRWLIKALQQIIINHQNNNNNNNKDNDWINQVKEALRIFEQGNVSVEISPLVSSEGEGLESYISSVIYQLQQGSCERVVIQHRDELPLEVSNI